MHKIDEWKGIHARYEKMYGSPVPAWVKETITITTPVAPGGAPAPPPGETRPRAPARAGRDKDWGAAGSPRPAWVKETITTTTTTPVDCTYPSIRNVTFQCSDASVVELDTKDSTITIDGLTIPIRLLRDVAKKINEEKKNHYEKDDYFAYSEVPLPDGETST